MTRVAKHRFDQEEALQAYDLLSVEERTELDGLTLSGGISTSGNARIRELETKAYTRLKEYKDGQS